MLITFQIVLFLIMILTVLGIISEREKDKYISLTSVCLAAIVASVVTFFV